MMEASLHSNPRAKLAQDKKQVFPLRSSRNFRNRSRQERLKNVPPIFVKEVQRCETGTECAGKTAKNEAAKRGERESEESLKVRK